MTNTPLELPREIIIDNKNGKKVSSLINERRDKFDVFMQFSSMREDRDRQIVMAHLRGETFRVIGPKFNLTAARCQQIFSKFMKRFERFSD